MIPFLTADNLRSPDITHGFFTRESGVSEGEFAALNVGYGSGDEMEKVRENRKRIAEALKASTDEVMSCYQIHSDVVHIIKSNDSSEKYEGDALVTNVPGVPIGILTADCVPVLFFDADAKVIGAAHAGWRGAQRGILQQTIQAMEQLGASKARLLAAIGPCIAGGSYEVGHDVFETFTAQDIAFSKCFERKPDGAHYWFDVGGAVQYILQRSGVANIKRLEYDTYAEESRFFSFRRSTHQKVASYGRQMSAIMLAEKG